MNSQNAIVTGASSGFGLLTSLELAKRGYQVVATMRDTTRQGKLISEAKRQGVLDKITISQLDVTSAGSVEEFKLFVSTLGNVTVLVNNAGFAAAGFAEEVPIDEYRRQFETNLFGMIAVTQVVLPIMRQKRHGKIINVSSISGRIGFPGMSPYVSSKFAVEGWSECLRLEVKPFGIEVILVEPGSYQTNIWSTGKEITERSLQEDSPYYHQMKRIEGYIQTSESQYGDPQEVAVKIAELAGSKEVTLRHPIGKGVKLTILLKNALSWKSWENQMLKRLFK
ncbi:SDR family oxidoreductase [Peribacillus sp. SCS-155]|uniref:SDR family oxidoreductase n=1 Tax=Peribacillus sedimenti TaxID=3115297 RepID=UPI00390628A7